MAIVERSIAPWEHAVAARRDPLDRLLPEGPSRGFVREPWSEYERLRRQGSVVWSERGQCFFVFRYDEVCNLLTREDVTAEHPFRGSRVAFGSTILDSEGADHARLREMLSTALRPTRLGDVGASVVRPVVQEELAGLAFIGDASDDLTLICDIVPLKVICALLGVPGGDVPWIRTTMAPLVTVVDRGPRGVAGVAEARKLLLDYLDDVVLGTASRPVTALLGQALAQAVHEGVVSAPEARGHALLLLVAGSATTACAMANAAHHCLAPAGSSPLDGGHRVEDVVREALRLEPPLRFTARFARAELAVGDVVARKGDAFQLCIASANRDGDAFDDPSQFSPDRRRNPAPLTFGRGLHGCLGAALSQLEVAAFLEEIRAIFGSCAVVASNDLAPSQSFRRPRELRLCRVH